jgi:hypothetical protein
MSIDNLPIQQNENKNKQERFRPVSCAAHDILALIIVKIVLPEFTRCLMHKAHLRF